MHALGKFTTPWNDPQPKTDVIFVMEGTASCGAYLNELKQAYIIPTLEYFNGGPLGKKPKNTSALNKTVYGLVIFHAADVFPGNLTDAYGPITTPQEILSVLDEITFAGGHGEAKSYVGEGLATAMQCLDDITNFRKSRFAMLAKKHVILICDCEPYGLPVTESGGADDVYSGITTNQVALQMKERDIYLSIFSPRKIPALTNLFEKSGGKTTSQNIYGRDVRHLVLLNGFTLQEKPVTSREDGNDDGDVTPIGENLPRGYKIPSRRPPPPDFLPIAPQPDMSRNNAFQISEGSQISPLENVLQYAYQAQPYQRQVIPSASTPSSTQLQGTQGSMPAQQSMFPSEIQSPFQCNQHFQRPQQCQSQGNPPLGLSTPDKIISDRIKRQEATQIIWSGILEYSKRHIGKLTRSIAPRHVFCKISVSTENGRPKVCGHGWPTKLTMQWIPKVLLCTLGGADLMKGVRRVFFTMQPSDSLNSLTRGMLQGFVGCVHFTGSGVESSACNVKLLILVYSKEREVYLGFIPNDQKGFAERLKGYIGKRKMKQQVNKERKAFPGASGISPSPMHGHQNGTARFQQRSNPPRPPSLFSPSGMAQSPLTPVATPIEQCGSWPSVSIEQPHVTPTAQQFERPEQLQQRQVKHLDFQQASDTVQRPVTFSQLEEGKHENACLQQNFNAFLQVLEQYPIDGAGHQQQQTTSLGHEGLSASANWQQPGTVQGQHPSMVQPQQSYMHPAPQLRVTVLQSQQTPISSLAQQFEPSCSVEQGHNILPFGQQIGQPESLQQPQTDNFPGSMETPQSTTHYAQQEMDLDDNAILLQKCDQLLRLLEEYSYIDPGLEGQDKVQVQATSQQEMTQLEQKVHPRSIGQMISPHEKQRHQNYFVEMNMQQMPDHVPMFSNQLQYVQSYQRNDQYTGGNLPINFLVKRAVQIPEQAEVIKRTFPKYENLDSGRCGLFENETHNEHDDTRWDM